MRISWVLLYNTYVSVYNIVNDSRSIRTSINNGHTNGVIYENFTNYPDSSGVG